MAHPTAAPAQINTLALQSLGRRFFEQQTLVTPAVPKVSGKHKRFSNFPFSYTASSSNCPGFLSIFLTYHAFHHSTEDEEEKESDDEDVEDFKLFSQLENFERVVSQRPPEDLAPASQSPSSAEELETDMLHVCHDSAPEIDEDDGEGPSTQPPPAPDAAETVAPAATVNNPVDPAPGNNNSLTPAVHSADRVQLNSGGLHGVFPIFRSKKDCKILYMVRHGESTYNRALSMQGSTWAEPQIYDAPLTRKGREQASALRPTVYGWDLPKDVVWITSPLTRAIETMLLAFPGGPPYPLHGHMDGTDYHDTFRNVFVLPEVSEHLMTPGDIGRLPEDLAEQFPQLSPQLSGLPQHWWYNRPKCQADKVNCAYEKKFGAQEPKEDMQRRIRAFRQWMLSRPETTFVAVGHSVFWKHFAASCKNGLRQESLKNCSWVKLHV